MARAYVNYLMEPKRLNKLISDSGFCSRREADKLIEQGRVTVNGKIPEAGIKVKATDKVRIDDQTLAIRHEDTVFLLFNKPAGIATTTDLAVKNNIIQALNYPATLLPIGFLDRDAEGLMLLSNDTELVRKITKADTKFEKEYVVTVNKMITPEFLSRISEAGIYDYQPDRKKNFVSKEGPNRFRIVLEPNTNHHIKKLCEDLGYKVVHLLRTKLGHFTPAKLAVGFWRVLTVAEVDELKSLITNKGSRSRAATSHSEELYDDAPVRSRTLKPRSSSSPVTRSGGAVGRKPATFNNPKSAAHRAGGKNKTVKRSPVSAKKGKTGPTEKGRSAKRAPKS